MPSSSRIVFAEDLVGAAPWQPGALEGGDRRRGERRSPRDRRADDTEAPPPTFDDGVRQGFEQGAAHERTQSAARERQRLAEIAARGDALLAEMTTQAAALQHRMADEVVGLAVAIARRIVGAAIAIKPDHVTPVVVEALRTLADEQSHPVVRLHPDDAALLAESLEPLLAARGATLLSDASVSPGGCLVDTPRASVDATLQTRWHRTLAAIGRDDEWVDA